MGDDGVRAQLVADALNVKHEYFVVGSISRDDYHRLMEAVEGHMIRAKMLKPRKHATRHRSVEFLRRRYLNGPRPVSDRAAPHRTETERTE